MAGKTEYKNNWQREKVDRVNLTMAKGRKDAIRAAAAAVGESVNAYINTAIAQRMKQESPSEPTHTQDSSLTPLTLETAQRAAEFTGETVSTFLERAAEVQAERDQRTRGLAGQVAGVKSSKKRGDRG